MRVPALYFNWLQKGNFTGTLDRFPQLKNRFETTVPGLYCIGDLTGIPLIKLAAESGWELMEQLRADEGFARDRRKGGSTILDIVIIGAGPAGMAASLRAAELGYTHVVLEAARRFNTIGNYPAGKPIYVTPAEPPMRSGLPFTEGTKETLLEELRRGCVDKDLPVREGESVTAIAQTGNSFTVRTSAGSFTARRVIVALGKTGNARTLGVPGEELPHVYTRLIDPGEYHDTDIVIVGGGDTALEAAVALADTGNRVTLSYRKSELSRPKESNVMAFEKRVRGGSISPVYSSHVTTIREKSVTLETPEGTKELPCQAGFILIGTEIPLAFFRRSGIRMEGELRPADWLKNSALLLFASLLYFGMKAPDTRVTSWREFFTLPSIVTDKPWPAMLNGLFAWGSLIALAITFVYVAVHFLHHRTRYFSDTWNIFKYLFYAGNAVLLGWLYVAYKLLAQRPLFGDMADWYTIMFSVTIVVFGLRRIAVHPTGYIARQTALLMAIQVLLLCILPMFVFPALGRAGLLGDGVMREVFPDGSYWRAYGFVLAWPLFIHNLATAQPTTFWLVTGIVQTFVLIPLIVYKWGKGAYCGWICSCGALAETLGDEYRHYAPHGAGAKRLDNAGQVILWIAAAVTLLAVLAGPGGSATALDLYTVVVDIFFAGVLGVGVYFFMSGRFWCRFLCPLAALMHIYARFSPYRIFSNKKRCISCNICTKVCHMGIDVMGYANKGIPMNDVQCVRCSACVVNCPMQVLTFGKVDRLDLDNVRYRKKRFPLTRGWASGLEKKDIDLLVAAEGEDTKS